MKKILFTLFLLCACFYSHAQITFQKTYSGIDTEEGRSVQQTTDGGYIITGYYSSFCGGVSLIKTDAYGDTLWTKNFCGGFIRMGYSVQQTADGGYIVTGWTHSFGSLGYDVYLIKTDINGDLLWTKAFGRTGQELGYSVQQTTDGGYIITGRTDTLGGINNDVFLIKTDVNGDTLWTKTYDVTGDDVGNSVKQTTDGGYIIVAAFSDYLIKTDSNGDTLWTKTFGGINEDVVRSVQQTTDGGYICAGYTNSFGAGYYD
ncbi:MAG: hypothetical protein ABI855_04725, partial [Bacteroidota bacterium]